MRAVCLSGKIAALSLLIAPLAALLSPHATAATVRDSTYRLDTYALQLNTETQMITSLEGGFVDGTVVADNADLMPKKHIGGTTIEPIRARVRIDQFTQFLSDSLAGNSNTNPATGTVYYIDNAGKVQQQRALTGLTLSELAFPGLSGSKSGNALLLTLTLTAQSSTVAAPLAGALPPVQVDNSPAARAKRWAGDWRLQVPGLPTNRVTAIEPFTIRRSFAAGSMAGNSTSASIRGNSPSASIHQNSAPASSLMKPALAPQGAAPTTSPTQWEVPNLVFYMPAQDSQAWIAWHDDFVVQGNNSDAQEKTLALQFLAPDLKSTLMQLDCTGVGIVSAKYEQPLSSSPTAPTGFRVELYVETMKLTAPAPSVATAPPAGPTTPPTQPSIPNKPITPPKVTRQPGQ